MSFSRAVQNGRLLRAGQPEHSKLIYGFTTAYKSAARYMPNKYQLLVFRNKLTQVLLFEATQTRDDFRSFHKFAQHLNDAIKEGFRDREEGVSIIKAAKIAIWTSLELSWDDRIQAAKGIQTAYQQALTGGAEELLYSWKHRMRTVNEQAMAIEPTQAIATHDALRQRGEMSLARFLEAVK